MSDHQQRYKIIREITRSGLATVYEGEDPWLNRPVLLKVLHSHLARQKDLQARFEREARAGASLHHPNIVTVYDFGPWEDSYFIALEYVRGTNLKELLDKEGPLPWKRSLDITAKVLIGLDYAHARGVYHRDIKPSNILLSEAGEVKITDFGLATIEGIPAITDEGMVVGTPAYMSPEQVRGEKVDARSDIFSWGVTFYQMLTGCSPFEGPTYSASLTRVLTETPKPLKETHPELPEALSSVIQKALEKDREKRYQSCQQILDDLDTVIKSTSKSLKPIEIQANEGKPLFPNRIKRKPHTTSFAIGALILIIIAVYWFGLKPGKPLQEPEVGKQEAFLGSFDSLKEKLAFEPPSVPSSVTSTKKDFAEAISKEIQQKEFRNRVSESNTASPEKPKPVESELDSAGQHKEPGEISQVRSGATDQSSFLQILTQPWAKVYIDNQYYDTTPLDSLLRVAPGRHEIKLINPGFPMYSETMILESGQTKSIRVNLWENMSYLVLKVQPWAQVFLDGEYIGTTPFQAPVVVRAGTHSLTFKNPSFNEVTREVRCDAGDTLELKIKLEVVEW
ncbi:MAG: protein kinase [candidate division KSB1 bacterium]|nr:protein kinase [candidate division KSB1 bacterium]